MSTSPNAITPSRAKQLAMLQKLSEGLKKHQQTLSSLVIEGKAFTTPELIAAVQARLDSANAVLSTRATWQNTVKTDRDEQAKTKGFVSGLRQALLVAFAGSIDTLADFGLVGRKPRVISPEKKLAAAQKAKATRAARHTLGKKQKAAIKGTAPQAAPATSPSTASPTPAPVPTSPSPAAPAHPVDPSATTKPTA